MATARTQKILLVLGSLCGSLLLCEALARLVVKDGAARERAAFLTEIAVPTQEPGAALINRQHYRLHPYLGYTFRPRGGGNNQGFPAGIDYPYRKGEREFVIGLFGGSVAWQLSEVPQPLLDRLKPALSRRGYQKVTLLPFAVGGWRQPQSFHAMLAALPTLDMVVNLDGFNEIHFLTDMMVASQPADFPWPEVYGALAHEVTDEQVLVRGQLVTLKRDAAAVTKSFDAAPLAWSSLAHLAWRVYASRQGKKLRALRFREQETDRLDWRGYDPVSPSDVDRARAAYLDEWMDLIRLSRVLTESKHKLFFNFIQPNQHFSGSKPLSAEEIAMIGAGAGYQHVSALYERVRAMSTELNGEGIEVHFLGDLFKRRTQTLYKDECCHLNLEGLEFLANAIADRILASGRLDRVPEAVPGENH
jgi:hypothetical protein